jgi:hypothetical protein
MNKTGGMKKTAWLLFGVLAVLLLSLPASVVRADVAIQELPSVFDEFLIGGDLSVFYRYDYRPYFTNATQLSGVTSDNNWGEIFGRLNFTAKKKFPWAVVEGKFSPIIMSTIDRDVYGFVMDKAEVDFNKAYIKFSGLLDKYTVTLGMQDIQLEKQFLIGLGRTQETAYWLLFNQSFPLAARIDGDFGKFKTTVFAARSGDYVAQSLEGDKDLHVTGVDLHYDFMETLYVFGGFYAKIDDTEPGEGGFLTLDYRPRGLAQTDTYALDIGGDWTLGGFNLEGEFVYEMGGVKFADAEYDRKAFGCFAAAQYKFPVKLSPYAKFHFIYWPGDDLEDDGDIEEYDPMFLGWWAWNRWFIGEQVAEVWGLKTNTLKYIFEIGFYPVEPCQIQVLYIKHMLDEPYFPLGSLNPYEVTSTSFADEFNLFMNWQVNSFLFVHSGIGVASPNQGAKDFAGDNKSAFFGQLWLMFAF